MPECGSQCYLCDVPIRFDTYKGCSHACKYCFSRKFTDISKIKNGESYKSLENFISGKRTQESNWCDWNIPIHWGGMSDPFQPCEKTRRRSYECLKLFEKTKYPFIVSTKGYLIAEDEYLDILSRCNCVVQISLVCKSYDKIEEGCPSFEERLEIIRKISPKVKRVVVRIQPYMREVYKEVFENLTKFKEAGAYGVIIEGMKFKKKKNGLEKIGGDMCYKAKLLENDFIRLKKESHRLGIKFYVGENRLRKMGDSLTCCGCDDLEGFEVNKYNLNHILNGDIKEPTKSQKEKGSALCFRALTQTTISLMRLKDVSFEEEMKLLYIKKKKLINEIMGI